MKKIKEISLLSGGFDYRESSATIQFIPFFGIYFAGSTDNGFRLILKLDK